MVDIAPPVISARSPVPDTVNVLVSTNVLFTILDPGSNVNLKRLKVSINSVVAYDGNESTVDSENPGSFDNGFQGGFQGDSSGVIANGTGFNVVIDSENDFTDGIFVSVVIDFADFSGNIGTDVFSFVTEDLTAPELASSSPEDGESGVGVDVTVAVSLTDNLDGVDLETVNINIDSTVAYLGAVGGVDRDDPETWGGGFANGYTGTVVVNSNNGFDLTLVPPSDFEDYDEVLVLVSADDLHTPANSLSTSFDFIVTNPGNVHEIRILAGDKESQRRVGVGTSATDDYWEPFLNESLYNDTDGAFAGVIPGTVYLVRDGNGFAGSGDVVAGPDDGAGDVSDPGVIKGSIDYESGYMLIEEDSVQTWNTGEMVDVDFETLGKVVGLSKVEFLRAGTLTKDFETISSEVRVETVAPFREYIAVEVRPGEDILVDQAYDLKITVGPFTAVLRAESTGVRGIEFTS